MLSEQKELSPENREAREVLRRHLPSLDSAAIPTKSEVFVLCGGPARELHEAIETILQEGPSQPGEGIVPEPSRAETGEVYSRDEALFWLLHVMDKASGTVDAGDYRGNLLNAFCGDFGDSPDTFNLAIDRKLIHVSHDSDSDASTARLLDAGRQWLASQKLTRDGSTPIQTSPSPTGGDELDGLREAIIEIVLRETTDDIVADGWQSLGKPNVLVQGCRYVRGPHGRGYENPEHAARTFAGLIADSILSLISELRGRGMVRAPSRARQGDAA